MRIVECVQGSEQWEKLRNRPTASEFGKFVTPVRGDYSSQATAYAAKIVAKRLGVYTEPPPTWAMERGTELEPSAILAYEKQTGCKVQRVGFILPDNTSSFGGSPDGLVGDDGGVEVKSPLPETLIAWHAAGILPIQHKVQVQGYLFISGKKWWDFYGFCLELTPFMVHVEPDLAFHEKMAANLLRLLQEIERIESLCPPMEHELVTLEGTTKSDVKWESRDDE